MAGYHRANRYSSVRKAPAEKGASSRPDGGVACWQINLQHSKVSTLELSRWIIEKQQDTGNGSFVCFIQEPYLFRGKLPHLAAHKCFVPAADARTAIVCSKDINLWFAPEFSHRDLTTCTVKLKSGVDITVCSVYCDILHQRIDPMLSNVVERPGMKIICCDSNAHSELWGSPEANARGEMFEDFIVENNLVLLNTGSVPTYIGRGARTHIDFTLTSVDAEELTHSWKVEEETVLSDHRIISFVLTISVSPGERRWNVGKGDWPLFQAGLEAERLVELPYWDTVLIDREAKAFEDLINKHLGRTCPKTSGFSGRRIPDDWWTEEIAECRHQVRLLERQAHRAGPEERHAAWHAYSAARREFTTEIRKAKRLSWKAFVSEVKTPKGMAMLNGVLKSRENKVLGILKKPDGSFCTTPDESMDLLINTHFPGNTAPEADEDLDFIPLPPIGTSVVEQCAIISEEKVHAAIHSLKPLKAPGPDGFKPLVLQNLGTKMLQRLTRLYQAILTLGYTPRRWRASKVIFIPKPGKEDYAQPKAFRPISLMPVFYKVLEKLALWEMEETALKDSPISRFQHGFKKGFSTETALSTLIDSVEKAMLKGKYALVTFLDIEGAFDNVSYESVEAAMVEKAVNPLLIRWYMDFLYCRNISAEIAGVQRKRALTRGVPQGGVLSPLAWNLVFDSLLKAVNFGPFLGVGLADDGAIGMTGIDPGMMMQQMQQALDRALQWGTETGLNFSAKKTQVMLFTRKRGRRPACTLKMGGQKLSFVDQTRYLGLTLDCKLSWKLHIRNKTGQAKGQLVRIKNAIGKLWGPLPRAISWAYKAIVAPALTYGSLVWAHATDKGYAQSSLTRLSRLAALSTGNYLRGTPTAGLEVALGLRPLDLTAMNLGLNAFLRWKPILSGQIPRDYDGHLKRWQNTAKKLQLDHNDMDDISPRSNWERRFEVSDCTDGAPATDYDIICYTDGSKMDDKVGWGALIGTPDVRFTRNGALVSSATVYQAELRAIFKACESIADLPGTRVIIHTDSSAALWALKARSITSTSVVVCRDALNEIGATRQVTLKWIKAHAGHLGNEIADAAAKLGCDLAPCEAVPVANQLIKAKAKAHYDHRWEERWKQRPDCRQTKLWFPQVNTDTKAKNKVLLSLSRIELSLAIQYITGFNRLYKHQKACNRMEDIDSTCRLCLEDEESAWHVVAECPAICHLRADAFNVQLLQPESSWTPRQLVHFITALQESTDLE